MATGDASKTVAKLPEGIKPDVFFQWKINNFSNLTKDVSGKHNSHGFDWSFHVEKKPFLENKEEEELCFFFYSIPDNFSTLWKADFNVFYNIVNKDAEKSLLYENRLVHNYRTYLTEMRTGANFRVWSDPDQGFITDNELIIEASIFIKNIAGIPKMPSFDFSVHTDNLSDVALLIGDKKVYASKQILALHSPVFHAMFYGGFAEKNKDEIELKDIEYEEFIELLNVIYPSSKEVTDDSAQYLLKLGDRFQIAGVMDKAERFLIELSKLENSQKLLQSDKYTLHKLQGHCLSKLADRNSVIKIKESSVYNDLSETTIVALFERMAKLSQ